jgi:hypothetical protein
MLRQPAGKDACATNAALPKCLREFAEASPLGAVHWASPSLSASDYLFCSGSAGVFCSG